MAQGNPQLATWSIDEVVRLYEISNDVFVQIDSRGGFANNASSPAPYLRFVNDSEHLLVRAGTYSSAATIRTLALPYVSDPIISTQNRPAASANILAGGSDLFNAADGDYIFMSPDDDPRSRAAQTIVDSDGQLILGGDVGYPAPTELTAAAISPDGKLLVGAQAIGTRSNVWVRHSYHEDGHPIYGDPQAGDLQPAYELEVRAPIDGLAWASNGDFMFGVGGDGYIQGYRRVDDNLILEWVHQTTRGAPTAIVASPDSRTIAISFEEEGVFSTVLYERTGPYLAEEQVLSGIGQALTFSGGGTYLIDAISRVAFKRQPDLSFALLSGAMDNVASGVRSQAVSSHVLNLSGRAHLYRGAVGSVALREVDLSNTRLTLLSEAAEFNPDDASIGDVTSEGAFEVTDAGWPAGGKVLTGVQFAPLTGGLASLTADPCTHIAVEEALSHRHVVIYDATDQTPIVFVEFPVDYTTPEGAELRLTFEYDSLLIFST
ncbi:hypothetical protein [Amorphus orientalis]|uniref:Uncharacterized protein n=1 Tax=Amorphus orientalis TaxID=649198 RepID=A0AAE3VSR4_9HYPH|nr:hypothetical protein [Amorphus orientalis]MDQ0317734.1 hypothetical protein [Amorphus orientalis]